MTPHREKKASEQNQAKSTPTFLLPTRPRRRFLASGEVLKCGLSGAFLVHTAARYCGVCMYVYSSSVTLEQTCQFCRIGELGECLSVHAHATASMDVVQLTVSYSSHARIDPTHDVFGRNPAEKKCCCHFFPADKNSLVPMSLFRDMARLRSCGARSDLLLTRKHLPLVGHVPPLKSTSTRRKCSVGYMLRSLQQKYVRPIHQTYYSLAELKNLPPQCYTSKSDSFGSS